MPKLRKKTIYTFILVVVALYVVIAVIPAVTGKLTRTEAVTYGELKVSDDVTCYIVRDETVYLAKSAGTMSFKVKEGELVKRGAEVMVVHPAAGNYTGTLVNAVMHHCGDSLSSINGVIRPGIVHRIDKDTSGLLMIAKNDNAHRSLAAQLAAHSSTRGYKAIVYNAFSEDEGTVDEPIGRSRSNRLRQAVGGLNEKEAVTHYKVLERLGKYTFLELRLETGRTHQIRVHMTYINHPLLGDGVYGPVKNPFGVEGQLLHDKMRTVEGQKLAEDLDMRADLVSGYVGKIKERAPQLGKEYADNLRTRIAELVDGTIDVPEDRILLEAAIFADKASITEELVRLGSHISQLHSILASGGTTGKKLDFLVQEMNREANTIGAKANDLDITKYMLEIKAEVEKIREQVQNIE